MKLLKELLLCTKRMFSFAGTNHLNNKSKGNIGNLPRSGHKSGHIGDNNMDHLRTTFGIKDEELGIMFINEISNPKFNGGTSSAIINVQLMADGRVCSSLSFPNVKALNQYISHLVEIADHMNTVNAECKER